MSIFAGLPDPTAPGRAFQQGLAQAKAEREEREVRGALSAYAVNPDDPTAFERLAQYRPELAIQIRQDQEKRQQQAQVADLQRRFAAGDREAGAQLAGIDLEAYDKLADNERAQMGERVTAIGQAALRISQLPEAERPAAWDAAVDQLSANFPELAQFRGQYSPEALMSAIDSAKLVNDFFELERPRWTPIPENAVIVNTADPAAVQEYMSSLGQRGGIQTGEVVNGYRFKGGDPNDRNSWEQVTGGAGGNAGGNFRP